VHEQLRQRAVMGGERERPALQAFEAMGVKVVAGALIADFRADAGGAWL